MISMRLLGTMEERVVKVPETVGGPMKMLPYCASDFLRKVTVCAPLDRAEGAVIEVPETLSITMGTPLSIVSSAELEPVMDLIGMLNEVPVKEKVRPVPDQVSSLVAGFTRPRYWKVAEEPVGEEAGLEEVVLGLIEVVVVLTEEIVVFTLDAVETLVLLVVDDAFELLGAVPGIHCE